ncbi:hypothetical protein Tco_1563053 [Tanacetum coccineum]
MRNLQQGQSSGNIHVQLWQGAIRQNTTQSFTPNIEIFFPPLENDDGEDHPMVIQAKIGGLLIHRMYIDRGSASE